MAGGHVGVNKVQIHAYSWAWAGFLFIYLFYEGNDMEILLRHF